MKFQKYWPVILACLLAAPAVSADVADTYEIQAEPNSGLGSNVAVDVLGHDQDSVSVWLATGKGVSFSFDEGASWLKYSSENGLPSDNVSAMFSIDGRIWVATSHSEFIADELRSISDGVTYSDDNGLTWTQIDFSSTGQDIPFVWGGDRTVFDITGHQKAGFFDNRMLNADADWLFFTAFAGGFLASLDGGITWRRIYPSPADSIQYNLTDQAPSLRNRYFACDADTSHGDSLFVWAGTAGGIIQYVYAPPGEKLYNRQINAFTFCDTCSTENGSLLFVAGDNGVSIGTSVPGRFSSSFVTDGLPGKSITAITSIGDYLLVGTEEATSGLSTGLAVSVDDGQTFTPVMVADPPLTGANRRIYDFLTVSDRLYMAAEWSGLLMSLDSGQSWSPILIDTTDSLSGHNIVYSLDMVEDTMLIGTDTGLVELVMDNTGAILDTRFEDFEDTDSSSARIIEVRPQQFFADSAMTILDSTILWTVHRSAGASGTPMVGRRGWDYLSIDVDTVIDTTVIPPDTTIDTLVLDSAYFWNRFQVGRNTYDVDFFGDTAFVVGDSGIFFTTRGLNPANRFSARQYVNDTIVVATLDNDIVTAMEVQGDTVLFGTLNGLAISNDRGASFRIYRPNVDTLSADFFVNYTAVNTALGLTGDFVPAIGVQPVQNGLSRIWASGRPVSVGDNGISVGEYKTITNVDGDSVGFDIRWAPVHIGQFAWNFAFVNDSVFAATNDGLLMHDGERYTGGDDSGLFVQEWDVVELRDAVSGEVLVEPGTEVFGVAVIDSFLWVGTNDGTVRIALDGSGSQQLYQRIDSTTSADEVYAFPVPFSSVRNEEVDFHFVVEEAGYVTLEIYDFAMNLVARPLDNVYYDAGIYPDGSSQGATWDGFNGNGDRAAVGIYYFKVEFGSGESRWGKLAIIP